jgi:ankyrin repeat protein
MPAHSKAKFSPPNDAALGMLDVVPMPASFRSSGARLARTNDAAALDLLDAALRGTFLTWRELGRLSHVSAKWRTALEQDAHLHASRWHGICLAVAQEEPYLRVPRAFPGGWLVCFWSELHGASARAQIAAQTALRTALAVTGPVPRDDAARITAEAIAARGAVRRRISRHEAEKLDKILYMATLASEQNLVGALLLNGADPNVDPDALPAADDGGPEEGGAEEAVCESALFHACANNDAGIAKMLLGAGASPHVVSRTWAGGITPLYAAANHGNDAVVRDLLCAGARVNEVAKDGFSPLLIATQEGRVETVALLLAHGAEVNHMMRDGFTALLLAAQEGHARVAAQLLAAGADATAAVPDGATALLIAAQHGRYEVVRLLLDNVPIDAPMSDGATPLMVAAQNGHLPVVQLLLRYGANPRVTTRASASPIVHAARMGHHEVVDELALAGADVNAGRGTENFFSPMLWACQEGYLGVARVLLRHGVHVEQAAANGATPLVYATYFHHHEIAQELLRAGANSAGAAAWLRQVNAAAAD